MKAQVLTLQIPKWENVLDAKGRPIAGFKRLKSTGVIHYRKTFKKLGIPPMQISTGETTIGRAKTKAEIEVQRWKNKHLGIDDTQALGRRRMGKSFKEAVRYVLENYTPTQKARTQENHKIYMGQLSDLIGHYDVSSITVDTLDEVITRVRRIKRVSPTGKPLPVRQTFMDYAKNLNTIMRIAYERRWVQHMVKFKNPDPKKDAGRLLKSGQAAALWNAMNEDTKDQFVLALECVMRLREAICAPWSELNLKTGVWTLPAERVKTGSKTGRGRSFKISPRALERMRARHARRDKDSPWIFPSPKDPQKPIWSTKTAWRTAKEKAGIKGRCRWHDLRHTGLTWMILGDPDASADVRAKMVREPIKVSVYAGVSMKTIETVYLKRRAKHTEDVAGAIDLLREEE